MIKKGEYIDHNNWVGEIKKYINVDDEINVVKFALSYTLQSLRAGEDINRFKWGDSDE